MTPDRSSAADDANAEITALITTLHDTGKRLEELTGGEVDSVTDKDGQTFLLRHAQEQLRHAEAVKQAAILNALPAHIALLDAQGTIVSVNEAWRSFARANGLLGNGYGTGLNYLAICKVATGDCLQEAEQAAEGIHAVLNGTQEGFSLEYPCHSPSQQRWFVMTVSPLASDHRAGVVVMHVDITDRKIAEDLLRTSEADFRGLSEAMPQIVWVTRPDGWNVYVNQQWIDYTGLTPAQSRGHGWIKPFHPDDQQRAWDAWQQATVSMGIYSIESRLQRADGVYRWWLVRGVPIRDAAGKLIKWFGTCTDIHELKSAGERIKHMNRMYAVLSGINALIVRCRNRSELYRDACRIAVECGEFPLAWIGIVQSNLTVSPVAVYGLDDGFLETLSISLDPEVQPGGQSPTAKTLRENRAFVCNDVANDPEIIPWRDAALQRGYRSSVTLPLVVRGVAAGSFHLYSAEVNAFDPDEMKLLHELAENISYAMEFILREEEANYLAYYDALTGLANQKLFSERVDRHILAARKNKQHVAVAFVDLDRFAYINATLGRPVGDEVLKRVAARLTRLTGDARFLARTGAGHFLAVMPGLTNSADLMPVIAGKVMEWLSRPFDINGTEVRVAGKAGLAVFPEDGEDADGLMRNAETAVKLAKRSGEKVLFYTRRISESMRQKATLEAQLRSALERQEFVLHYQPKVDLQSNKVISAEALMRWQSAESGLVLPPHFIGMMEETGLILQAGEWALRQALSDRLRWQSMGLSSPRVAVNVSPLQIGHQGFPETMRGLLSGMTGMEHGIDIEVTESTLMSDVESCMQILNEIRDLGVEIALDDFGTGYSSLAHLARLPINAVKIDRSFITSMTDNANNMSMVSTIITLAHSMNFKVIAEGVDSPEQLKFLRLLRCDQIQGFLFSKGLPADEFAELLRQDRTL